MQIEIIGTDGKVHYRRPHTDHAAIVEALNTPGYSVRWPGCRDMAVLENLPKCDGVVTCPDEGLTLRATCTCGHPAHVGVCHWSYINVGCPCGQEFNSLFDS